MFRTYIVWGKNIWVIVLPLVIFGAAIGKTGYYLQNIVDPDSNCLATSVLFTWSINEAKPGTSVLISNVFLRSKYFYMSTLALNLLCTGEVMVLKGFHALF